SINQVEITSCGLNDGPLKPIGKFPAPIACNLTNGNMPHGSNSIYTFSFPNVTHKDNERFIAEIGNGTLIGFKYFDFKGTDKVTITVRKETEENKVVYEGPVRKDERCETEDSKTAVKEFTGEKPYFSVLTEEKGEEVGRIYIPSSLSSEWTDLTAKVNIPDGVKPLYFIYNGNDKLQMHQISF
ncbi:MAG: glycosyl hydrolase family 43, partial [Oscillospiraceae bacterium]|nr:glycosyl hydrolase family 43 [Oscillospiraceae bacterium]